LSREAQSSLLADRGVFFLKYTPDWQRIRIQFSMKRTHHAVYSHYVHLLYEMQIDLYIFCVQIHMLHVIE